MGALRADCRCLGIAFRPNQTRPRREVLITGRDAVTWFDHYRNAVPHAADDRCCPISYTTFLKWLRWITVHLKHGAVGWTCHSLRRGRATDLFRRGVEVQRIMDWGRWESFSSCRLYLRRADVEYMRFMFSTEAVAAATAFASLGWRVFTQRL